MVLTTFAVAMLRYLLDMGWIALQESVTYMHGLLFMLAAAYTLKHDAHVRVDLVYAARSPRFKALVDLAGTLLLLLPMAVFLLVQSVDYVVASWRLWEGSREAGGLNLVWLLKSALLVMPLLMIVQGLSNGARAWAELTLMDGGDLPPSSTDGCRFPAATVSEPTKR
ncbi:MAG: TRAP transporter small permease subunit [Magnetococcales bacterium]|nr:TRAP transporter small permease subunit [Magnetococcales bacterium]